MAKILVADKITEEGRDLLIADGAHELIYEPTITPEALLQAVSDVEAIVVRSRAQVTGDVIRAAPKLRVIGRAGVGLDNVDLATATSCGVIVMNAPEGNTISTAEHTIAMMMASARHIAAATASMRQGVWEKSKYQGVELRGKTIGIIGLGRIGREVASRMLAFKAQVLAYDPFVTAEAMAELGIAAATVDEIVEKADFLTVHVPLTDKTRNLIDAAALARMKKTAHIINCARGGIVDEVALAKALTAGKIAGAAFDVFEQEPPPADHPLLKAPNTVLTPHLAASTGEAQQLVTRDLALQILDVLDGGIVRNAANFPRITPESYKLLKPYCDLGERLGKFLSQFCTGSVTGLRASFEGRVAEQSDLGPITTALVYGYLKPISSHRLNYVNARHTLSAHGIAIEETRQSTSTSEYSTVVQLEAQTKEGKRYVVAGTLFGKHDSAKLVRVNDVWLDSSPEGEMIIVENADVPGVIGKVATLLGDHGLNIAQVAWGRTAPGGEALTVINLDQPVTADVIAQLRAIPQLRNVQQVVV